MAQNESKKKRGDELKNKESDKLASRGGRLTTMTRG
jgi:hypothetical protein